MFSFVPTAFPALPSIIPTPPPMRRALAELVVRAHSVRANEALPSSLKEALWAAVHKKIEAALAVAKPGACQGAEVTVSAETVEERKEALASFDAEEERYQLWLQGLQHAGCTSFGFFPKKKIEWAVYVDRENERGLSYHACFVASQFWQMIEGKATITAANEANKVHKRLVRNARRQERLLRKEEEESSVEMKGEKSPKKIGAIAPKVSLTASTVYDLWNKAKILFQKNKTDRSVVNTYLAKFQTVLKGQHAIAANKKAISQLRLGAIKKAHKEGCDGTCIYCKSVDLQKIYQMRLKKAFETCGEGKTALLRYCLRYLNDDGTPLSSNRGSTKAKPQLAMWLKLKGYTPFKVEDNWWLYSRGGMCSSQKKKANRDAKEYLADPDILEKPKYSQINIFEAFEEVDVEEIQQVTATGPVPKFVRPMSNRNSRPRKEKKKVAPVQVKEEVDTIFLSSSIRSMPKSQRANALKALKPSERNAYHRDMADRYSEMKPIIERMRDNRRAKELRDRNPQQERQLAGPTVYTQHRDVIKLQRAWFKEQAHEAYLQREKLREERFIEAENRRQEARAAVAARRQDYLDRQAARRQEAKERWDALVQQRKERIEARQKAFEERRAKYLELQATRVLRRRDTRLKDDLIDREDKTVRYALRCRDNTLRGVHLVTRPKTVTVKQGNNPVWNYEPDQNAVQPRWNRFKIPRIIVTEEKEKVVLPTKTSVVERPEGTLHQHRCVKCNILYEHIHNVKHEDHGQFEYQCPNRRCFWYWQKRFGVNRTLSREVGKQPQWFGDFSNRQEPDLHKDPDYDPTWGQSLTRDDDPLTWHNTGEDDVDVHPAFARQPGGYYVGSNLLSPKHCDYNNWLVDCKEICADIKCLTDPFAPLRGCISVDIGKPGNLRSSVNWVTRLNLPFGEDYQSCPTFSMPDKRLISGTPIFNSSNGKLVSIVTASDGKGTYALSNPSNVLGARNDFPLSWHSPEYHPGTEIPINRDLVDLAPGWRVDGNHVVGPDGETCNHITSGDMTAHGDFGHDGSLSGPSVTSDTYTCVVDGVTRTVEVSEHDKVVLLDTWIKPFVTERLPLGTVLKQRNRHHFIVYANDDDKSYLVHDDIGSLPYSFISNWKDASQYWVNNFNSINTSVGDLNFKPGKASNICYLGKPKGFKILVENNGTLYIDNYLYKQLCVFVLPAYNLVSGTPIFNDKHELCGCVSIRENGKYYFCDSECVYQYCCVTQELISAMEHQHALPSIVEHVKHVPEYLSGRGRGRGRGSISANQVRRVTQATVQTQVAAAEVESIRRRLGEVSMIQQQASDQMAAAARSGLGVQMARTQKKKKKTQKSMMQSVTDSVGGLTNAITICLAILFGFFGSSFSDSYICNKEGHRTECSVIGEHNVCGYGWLTKPYDNCTTNEQRYAIVPCQYGAMLDEENCWLPNTREKSVMRSIFRMARGNVPFRYSFDNVSACLSVKDNTVCTGMYEDELEEIEEEYIFSKMLHPTTIWEILRIGVSKVIAILSVTLCFFVVLMLKMNLRQKSHYKKVWTTATRVLFGLLVLALISITTAKPQNAKDCGLAVKGNEYSTGCGKCYKGEGYSWTCTVECLDCMECNVNTQMPCLVGIGEHEHAHYYDWIKINAFYKEHCKTLPCQLTQSSSVCVDQHCLSINEFMASQPKRETRQVVETNNIEKKTNCTCHQNGLPAKCATYNAAINSILDSDNVNFDSIRSNIKWGSDSSKWGETLLQDIRDLESVERALRECSYIANSQRSTYGKLVDDISKLRSDKIEWNNRLQNCRAETASMQEVLKTHSITTVDPNLMRAPTSWDLDRCEANMVKIKTAFSKYVREGILMKEFKFVSAKNECDTPNSWKQDGYFSTGTGLSCTTGISASDVSSVSVCGSNKPNKNLNAYRFINFYKEGDNYIAFNRSITEETPVSCVQMDQLYEQLTNQPLCTSCFGVVRDIFWDVSKSKIPEAFWLDPQSMHHVRVYSDKTVFRINEANYTAANQVSWTWCCNGRGPASLGHEYFFDKLCACSLKGAKPGEVVEAVKDKVKGKLVGFGIFELGLILISLLTISNPRVGIICIAIWALYSIVIAGASCQLGDVVGPDSVIESNVASGKIRIVAGLKVGSCINIGTYVLRVKRIFSEYQYRFEKSVPYKIKLTCVENNWKCWGGNDESYNKVSNCVKECGIGINVTKESHVADFPGDKCAIGWSGVALKQEMCFSVGSLESQVRIYKVVTIDPVIKIEAIIYTTGTANQRTVFLTEDEISSEISIESLRHTRVPYPRSVAVRGATHFCSNVEPEVQAYCGSVLLDSLFTIHDACLDVQSQWVQDKEHWTVSYVQRDAEKLIHNYYHPCDNEGNTTLSGHSLTYQRNANAVRATIIVSRFIPGDITPDCDLEKLDVQSKPGVVGWRMPTIVTITNNAEKTCKVFCEIDGCVSMQSTVVMLEKGNTRALQFYCRSNSTTNMRVYNTRTNREVQLEHVNKHFSMTEMEMQVTYQHAIDNLSPTKMLETFVGAWNKIDVGNLWHSAVNFIMGNFWKYVAAVIVALFAFLSFERGNILFCGVWMSVLYVVLFTTSVFAHEQKQDHVEQVAELVLWFVNVDFTRVFSIITLSGVASSKWFWRSQFNSFRFNVYCVLLAYYAIVWTLVSLIPIGLIAQLVVFYCLTRQWTLAKYYNDTEYNDSLFNMLNYRPLGVNLLASYMTSEQEHIDSEDEDVFSSVSRFVKPSDYSAIAKMTTSEIWYECSIEGKEVPSDEEDSCPEESETSNRTDHEIQPKTEEVHGGEETGDFVDQVLSLEVNKGETSLVAVNIPSVTEVEQTMIANVKDNQASNGVSSEVGELKSPTDDTPKTSNNSSVSLEEQKVDEKPAVDKKQYESLGAKPKTKTGRTDTVKPKASTKGRVFRGSGSIPGNDYEEKLPSIASLSEKKMKENKLPTLEKQEHSVLASNEKEASVAIATKTVPTSSSTIEMTKRIIRKHTESLDYDIEVVNHATKVSLNTVELYVESLCPATNNHIHQLKFENGVVSVVPQIGGGFAVITAKHLINNDNFVTIPKTGKTPGDVVTWGKVRISRLPYNGVLSLGASGSAIGSLEDGYRVLTHMSSLGNVNICKAGVYGRKLKTEHECVACKRAPSLDDKVLIKTTVPTHTIAQGEVSNDGDTFVNKYGNTLQKMKTKDGKSFYEVVDYKLRPTHCGKFGKEKLPDISSMYKLNLTSCEDYQLWLCNHEIVRLTFSHKDWILVGNKMVNCRIYECDAKNDKNIISGSPIYDVNPWFEYRTSHLVSVVTMAKVHQEKVFVPVIMQCDSWFEISMEFAALQTFRDISNNACVVKSSTGTNFEVFVRFVPEVPRLHEYEFRTTDETLFFDYTAQFQAWMRKEGPLKDKRSIKKKICEDLTALRHKIAGCEDYGIVYEEAWATKGKPEKERLWFHFADKGSWTSGKYFFEFRLNNNSKNANETCWTDGNVVMIDCPEEQWEYWIWSISLLCYLEEIGCVVIYSDSDILFSKGWFEANNFTCSWMGTLWIIINESGPEAKEEAIDNFDSNCKLMCTFNEKPVRKWTSAFIWSQFTEEGGITANSLAAWKRAEAGTTIREIDGIKTAGACEKANTASLEGLLNGQGCYTVHMICSMTSQGYAISEEESIMTCNHVINNGEFSIKRNDDVYRTNKVILNSSDADICYLGDKMIRRAEASPGEVVCMIVPDLKFAQFLICVSVNASKKRKTYS
ncbi:MAG: polyprotein [Fushun laodelphax striatellus flavivirus 1]|nr:MAG: polyprotein [Fushun laodelphax striatellus flavivirus 1]